MKKLLLTALLSCFLVAGVISISNATETVEFNLNYLGSENNEDMLYVGGIAGCIGFNTQISFNFTGNIGPNGLNEIVNWHAERTCHGWSSSDYRLPTKNYTNNYDPNLYTVIEAKFEMWVHDNDIEDEENIQINGTMLGTWSQQLNNNLVYHITSYLDPIWLQDGIHYFQLFSPYHYWHYDGDDFYLDRVSLTLICERKNSPPIANAGPDQSAHTGNLVTLDASGSSDPEENYPLSYNWTIVSKPAGSTAVLSDPAAVNPGFTADLPGDYIFELTVTDSLGLLSAPDTVLASTVNTPPVADAGPDQAIIQINTMVQLNGSGSYDLDGDPVAYAWNLISKPEGSAAILSDPNAPNPTFIADIHGDYVLALAVSDPWSTSAPDTITIGFENIAPVAQAGNNRAVIINQTVFLNGGGSYDANLDPLTYSWSFVAKPAGSNAALSDPAEVNPLFVADVAGEYIVSLVANDGFVDSAASNITVVAITHQDAATDDLQNTIDEINAMDPGVFKNPNLANTLTNKINTVLSMIDRGEYANALDKLQNDILGKTDGCALNGTPDNNDWIRTCEEQNLIYPLITDAIEHLEQLLNQ